MGQAQVREKDRKGERATRIDLLGPTMPRDGAANMFLATLSPKLAVLVALLWPLSVNAAADAAAAAGGTDCDDVAAAPAAAPAVVHRRFLYALAATVAGAAAHGSGLCNGSRADPSS